VSGLTAYDPAPLILSDFMSPLRGAAVGAGYFSQFHYEAWSRMDGAAIVAVCDVDLVRARATAARFGIERVYDDVARMLDAERPDFVDVITPPPTHEAICRAAFVRGTDVICQKALAPSYAEAVSIVEAAETAGVRFMVHDNFRFQPWHREVRKLIDAGTIGHVHAISARTRMGDGWGPDAYLERQPYFRTMPRLLVFETGVHFIDVCRYLGGEAVRAFARLRRLNPVIAGEDAGLLILELANGATFLWDANRYNESSATDPRYTFGTFLVEGDRGSLSLDEEGTLVVQPLGAPARQHPYAHERRGFAGDCVYFTLQHFVEQLRNRQPFETEGRDYLRTLAVQDAVYRSAASGCVENVVV
jgi:predicted dehydrogenase